MKRFRFNPAPLVFLVLSAVGLRVSGMDPTFVVNETIVRFVRDGVTVLALIVPITAGMGLNFAVTVGALCAQVGLVIAVDYQLAGFWGLGAIVCVGVPLSILCGLLIGLCLNRVRGREMIATIIIGFVATSIYQLVFMVGYGTVIEPNNPEMMLSGGVGIRNMVDLAPFRNLIDKIWLFSIRGVEIPLFMIMTVCFFALAVHYMVNTKLGARFRAVGQSPRMARLAGIDVDAVRVKAIVVSTVLACFGHIIYIQNIGMLNVYSAHLNTDIFSCAAILAGGATIFKARVSHAFLGIFLFHTLFIVSPQAGQNVFGNPALGEYFRSFVAYGTIAFALAANLSGKEKIQG